MNRICKTTQHKNYQLQELWTDSASCLPWLCILRPLTRSTINKVRFQHFSFLALSFIMSEGKKHKRAKGRAAQRVLQWLITVSALPLSAFHLFFPSCASLMFIYLLMVNWKERMWRLNTYSVWLLLRVAHTRGSLSGFTLLQSTYSDIFPSKCAPNG